MNTQNSVKVWDLPLRIFHWALAAFFVSSYVSGEEESVLHAWSGYAIVVLLMFRLLWGFIGSQHSRFADFVRGPREAAAYTRDTLTGRAKRYLGHNPAGGLMVIALIVSLFAATVTGLVAYGVDEGKGPLSALQQTSGQPVKFESIKMPSLVSAAWADDDGNDEETNAAGVSRGEHDESAWSEVHEFFANFTLLLVFIHLLGVFAESVVHRENLVRAMITGYKPKNASARDADSNHTVKQPNA